MRPKHFRRRPPWWPEDEPWPPTDRTQMHAWRLARRGFLLRMAVMLTVLLVLLSGGITFFLWLIGNALGIFVSPIAPGAGLPAAILGFIFVVLGLLMLVRSLSRVALPFGDLIGAAGRVAEGDYSVRVDERGPREVRTLAHAFNSMAERLQISDEMRRNLLADVTHEMRTPLTVIQGNLEGLVDGVYPRDDAHLEPILEEIRVLSRLIDDLRTLALAESGALKLQKEPTDLGILIRETVAFFRPKADAAGIALDVETDSELMATVDPARVRQVLDNLIANALRYTPSGGKICVTGRAVDKSVQISVTDTGQGIPQGDLTHVFDRFYKSRDSGGSGLGLAIAKNLVAAHGGQIAAESEVGKGTTIRFSLTR